MRIRTSMTLKIVSIGLLILLLLIPATMVQDVIRERQDRRNAVVREISDKWGTRQTIAGPFISVPYTVFVEDSSGKTHAKRNWLHLLPDTLDVAGELRPEVRYRSIFEAVLYTAHLTLTGTFVIPDAGQLSMVSTNIVWGQARAVLGITDMRGIQENIVISVNGTHYDADPGLPSPDLAAAGVSVQLGSLTPNQQCRFACELTVNGSEELHIIPAGKTTRVALASRWPSPSFNGAFLPAERTVSSDGFSARWKVLHLNRNYPQYWAGAQYKTTDSAFGLKLILTADIYQKSMRLAKYAVMFLALTFAAFFFSEVLNRRRLHPIQYILVGLALLVFYTLVLALSEHMRFNYAYLLSAAAVGLMISGYAKAVTASTRFALIIFGVLCVLYGYLFIVLQLEDYALLLGSAGLLLILAIIMFVTRSINWYELQTGPEAPARNA